MIVKNEDAKALIRVASIKEFGVHIVAEWEDGGSDAIDFSIHTQDDLIKEFPETCREDAKAFFEGKRDGIFVRRWTDAHNRKVIDKAYFRIDEADDEFYFPNEEITLEQHISMLPDEENDRLLQGLSDVLSGLGIGEGEAFKLLAEIEAIAIKKRSGCEG